jgi:hypothetical protein
MNEYQTYMSKNHKSKREKQIEIVYYRVLKMWAFVGVLIIIISIIS